MSYTVVYSQVLNFVESIFHFHRIIKLFLIGQLLQAFSLVDPFDLSKYRFNGVVLWAVREVEDRKHV